MAGAGSFITTLTEDPLLHAGEVAQIGRLHV